MKSGYEGDLVGGGGVGGLGGRPPPLVQFGSFSEPLFDVLRSRETPSSFSEKPNAFLILLRAFFGKGPQKYQ